MARCIVVGSVAVDQVVRLTTPLRPGAHLHGGEGDRRLGGGGANTAIPLWAAGHAVVLSSAVGSDADGDWLVAGLSAAGLDTSNVLRVEGPSTRSLVLVDPLGERTVVNLHRCRAPALLSRLDGLAAAAVYVRSGELELAPSLEGRLASGLVVAHVPPTGAGSRPAHVLVASESDLTDGERRSPWELGRAIAGDALRLVVVTRGSRGATGYTADGRFHAAAPRVEVVDGTGAGDVFTAGLLHALLLGAPHREALEAAAAWGAAAAACEGLPPPGRIRELTGCG